MPARAMTVAFDAAALRHARRSNTAYAQDAGLDADRVDDLLLVVGELAANSVRHGSGAGRIGPGPKPVAGSRPAHGHQLSGRGLLVVDHLADLGRTHTRPDGTTIRAYFQLPDAHDPNGS